MAADGSAAARRRKGEPLQIVTLNMDTNKVEVNEDALGRLEKTLRNCGTSRIAVVSVMGAFRTGKSFILDLLLRYLRFEDSQEGKALGGAAAERAKQPDRGEGVTIPMPAWLHASGKSVEGSTDDEEDGFRFKGGMDICTTGIWVWSEPFIRNIQGQPTAVLLMDTQGAWDGKMSKEQSATIFGLTAILSSKQVYNIKNQIQENYVENLAFFMEFAQAALRQAANSMPEKMKQAVNEKKPFQTLQFLVRDWEHFEDDWTMAQCQEQVMKHLATHTDPKEVVENSTVIALHDLFHDIRCFCMPHPGLKITKATWSGDVADIGNDFVRFADALAGDIFDQHLDVKAIIGSELSTLTFGMIVRNFVEAFHNTTPMAMTFCQAITNSSVLIAKEQAMKSYQKKMDDIQRAKPGGYPEEELKDKNEKILADVHRDYTSQAVFGSQEVINESWDTIKNDLKTLYERYEQDNQRRLEQVLVGFANLALLGSTLFVLDRISDWTCDWWSRTCVELSRVMMVIYLVIFVYVGFHVYLVFKERGKVQTAMAGGELWKEVMKLMGKYSDIAKNADMEHVQKLAKSISGQVGQKISEQKGGKQQESKKKN